MIKDIIMAQKKRVKVFFKVKFDQKIVFSLPASVRDTCWFLCLLGKN